MNPELADLLKPIMVLVPFTVLIVMFTQILTNYYLKRRMIQNGLASDEVNALLKKQEEAKYSALKWGLVTFFGGLGLIVLTYIPYEENSPLPFGILAVFLSLGFLVYYFLMKRENPQG